MQKFSNRQVTAMVIAVCAAILLAPVGVMAAVDQVRVHHGTKAGDLARVDNGQLRVGDGSGPITVDGRVATDTRMTLPATPFLWEGGIAPPTDQITLVERHGKGKLAVTSATATSGITTTDHTSVQFISWVANVPDWDCSSTDPLPEGSPNTGTNTHLSVTVGDTASATWPTPIVMFQGATDDTTSCLVLFQSGVGGASRHTNLSLAGYWVGF